MNLYGFFSPWHCQPERNRLAGSGIFLSVGLGVTWSLIPAVRSFALRVGWADLPNERRLNREPNAGGLVIYAGVFATLN